MDSFWNRFYRILFTPWNGFYFLMFRFTAITSLKLLSWMNINVLDLVPEKTTVK